MRRHAILVALALPAAAAAESFVVDEPAMYHTCPRGKTWEDVAACLAKHGRPHVVRAIARAKLVRLDQLEDRQWVDGGLYLYAERKGEWKISGAFFGRGSDYELLGFAPLVVGSHAGYRIDIGQTTPLWVQPDGLTTQRGLRRSAQALFCSTANNHCTHTVRSCEVLVRGKAYWTFRGALTVNGNEVTVAGDRRSAGPFCSQAERVHLGWPQT